MAASLSFEIVKLGKRPAVWVLGTILALILALVGYFLTYVFSVGVGESPPAGAEQFVSILYPASLVSNVLSVLSSFGATLALILGALAVGSEYGWDTLKVILTQRPGRLGVFSGKLLAVCIVLAAFALASFALGAVGSYVVAGLRDAPADWPAVGELLRGVGAGWLMMAAWASLGAFLATLFRGTALAIGLGLAYALVLENLVFGLSFASDAVEKVGRVFLGRNSADLAYAFGDVPQGMAPPFEAVEPAQAALVLGAYVVVFLALSALLFVRRDVV